MTTDLALLEWIENEMFGKPTGVDVLEKAPGLTSQQAYRLRAELVRRRIVQGDALVGYKIAGGWSGIRPEKAEPRGEPVVGSLMRSGLVENGSAYACVAGAKMVVEAECAVLLARDLQGPGLTASDVISAVDGYFPAIEIVPVVAGPRASLQQRILASKFTGGIVLGGPLASRHGIDLRLEGALMSINGEPRATATGIVIMGSPLNAVAEVANRLAQSEESLKAGMVVMTGTITGLTPAAPGDLVEAAFTRLGRASVRFMA